MFKNKNIKKFVSIVCSILTLNYTRSVFQRDPAAIRLDKQTMNNEEWYNIILDKQFYFIVVYDSPYETQMGKNFWAGLSPCDFLVVGLDSSAENNMHIHSIHSDDCSQQLMELLMNAPDDGEVMLAVGLQQTGNLNTMPELPYRFVFCPKSKQDVKDFAKYVSLTTRKNILKSLKYKSGDDSRIVVLTPLPHDGDKCTVFECSLGENNNVEIVYDSSGTKGPADKPEQHYMGLPDRVTTVKDLKDWIEINNPTMLPEPLKENQSHSNNQKHKEIIETKPELGQPRQQEFSQMQMQSDSIPKDEYNEQSRDTKEQTTTTTKSPTGDCQQKLYTNSSELNSCEKPITRNILCNTKKFITEHPEASVTIAAAISALVGNIMYNITKLFTRESSKSNIRNQITQKNNQYVRTKI